MKHTDMCTQFEFIEFHTEVCFIALSLVNMNGSPCSLVESYSQLHQFLVCEL
jgi:hypothetical protein